jgi:hypothetical protein
MRKLNSLRALLITGLIGLCSPSLWAGNPVTRGEEPTSKPTQRITSWCEIRGLFERVMDADGNSILICRMVADGFCYSIPCIFGMPLGNKPPQKNPVPQGVNIEEGQNFIAYYNSNNELQVVFTNTINATVSSDAQGNETLTVVLPR